MVTLFRPHDMVTPLSPKLLVKETTQTCGGPKSHSMIPNIQMKPKLIVKNTKFLLDNKCFNIFLCYYLLFSSTTLFLSKQTTLSSWPYYHPFVGKCEHSKPKTNNTFKFHQPLSYIMFQQTLLKINVGMWVHQFAQKFVPWPPHVHKPTTQP